MVELPPHPEALEAAARDRLTGVAALLAGLGDELRNAMVPCGQIDAAAVEPDIVVARGAVP